MVPKFLATVKSGLEESGWAEETDGTCEGCVELASQLFAGAGGLRVQAVKSTTPSSGTVEVIVGSKIQPDNAYVVKKVGDSQLVDEHTDSDDF